jgi:hypothetical protein
MGLIGQVNGPVGLTPGKEILIQYGQEVVWTLKPV